MTKQSYQIITYKNLYIYLVPSRFLTKITAPAPAKYGASTAPESGSATLLSGIFRDKTMDGKLLYLWYKQRNHDLLKVPKVLN